MSATRFPAPLGPDTPESAKGRRRFIDLTPGERECSALETEFMEAIQDYKRSSGRMFPTWSEVLEVARGLGYDQTAGR